MTRRLRAMGIRDKPIAPKSPWQNGVAERLIGSNRRDCTDHIIVFGETHLRRALKCYAAYYNTAGTHRSLSKDSSISCSVQHTGQIISHAILGGLHHGCVGQDFFGSTADHFSQSPGRPRGACPYSWHEGLLAWAALSGQPSKPAGARLLARGVDGESARQAIMAMP